MEQVAQFIRDFSPYATIIAGVITIALFAWRLRKKIIAIAISSADAAQHSQSAASTAEDTQTDLEDTRAQLVIVTNALEAATGALNKLRETHDDVWAALLRAESVQARLRLIEHAVADLEDTRGETPTKLISTRGGAHVDQ